MLDLKPLKKELIEFTLLNKSYSKLDADAKKLLLCASVFEEAVPVEALSWIIGDDNEASPSVGETLQKLIQRGLISKEQEYDQTVYTEHTIVRDFSLERMKEEGLDKKKLIIRAARYYENLAFQTRNLWCYLIARNYYFHAADWESAYKIVESTSDHLIRWGHIELVMNLLNESIKTTSGDARTNAEYTLATIYHHLGDLNTALKICNNVSYEYEERGDNEGVALVLHVIGMIHQDQGNYEEAVKKYNQALKIAEELRNKIGFAGTLHQLGNVHYLQGNYEEAVEKYNQALKIEEELRNKSGVARTLHQLGTIHQKQGNYEEAVENYSQALKIAEELGNKSGIATTLYALGMIHEAKKEYVSALQAYQKASSIYEKLNSPYSQQASELILKLKDKMGEEEFNVAFEKLREQYGS